MFFHRSVDILIDHVGTLVQNLRILQQTAVVLKEGSIAVAVYDSLIYHELHIHILPLDYTAILLNFQSSALLAKSTENGDIAKIIQMMVYRIQTQTTQRSEINRTVERTDFQKEFGKQTKLIQQLQQPDCEL